MLLPVVSPAGIASGAGIGPLDVGYILGVVKAYVTRVGEGPMPAEIHDSIGAEIATKGGEVGATTAGQEDVDGSTQLRSNELLNQIVFLLCT